MPNLGGFAGGLAQGLQQGQEMKMRQQELADNKNFRERQLKMQESDQAAQDEQRKRDADLRSQINATMTRYGYGPDRQVEDGYDSVDDGQGGVRQVARIKTVKGKKFGDDPASDLAATKDIIGLKLASSGDISQHAQLLKWAQEQESSEMGKTVVQGLSGDKDKYAAMVTKLGGNPSLSKFNNQDMTLDLGNGQPPVNVLNYLVGVGALQHAKHLIDVRDSGDKSNLNKAHVASLTADAELKPAKAEQLRASAAASRASANLANTKAGMLTDGGGGAKPSAAENQQIKLATTDKLTGKTDADAASYIMTRLQGVKGGDRMKAIGTAKQEYTQSVSEASQMLAANKDNLPVLAKKLAAKGINVQPTPEGVRAGLIQLGLSRFGSPAKQTDPATKAAILAEKEE